MNLYNFLINLIIPLVIFSSVYLSYKIKFSHLFGLHKIFHLFKHNSNDNKNISSFTALSTVLGGNLGTGNISGVAVALSTGGAGSLFWMSVIIFMSSVIKYVGCFLGVKYRIQNKEGQYVGGPMYYIQNAMSSPKLAVLFSALLIIAALTVGNLVQVNSLVLPIMHSGIPPLWFGILIALLVFVVTIGGVYWFAEIITKIVPAMAVLYLSACIYILITNYNMIIPAFMTIFSAAFNMNSVSSGAMGYGVFHIISSMKVGLARGIFATDTGLGLEAIVHSSVNNNKSSHDDQFAIEQSKISILSPFIVMIMCIITGLVLIVTDVWQGSLESTNMCFAAFNIGIPYQYSGYIMLFTLFCFAFTTILTWMFCANKAVEYLAPNKKMILLIWRLFFIFMLPIGAIMKIDLLWYMADIVIFCMLLLNLYSLIRLSDNIACHNSALTMKMTS